MRIYVQCTYMYIYVLHAAKASLIRYNMGKCCRKTLKTFRGRTIVCFMYNLINNMLQHFLLGTASARILIKICTIAQCVTFVASLL